MSDTCAPPPPAARRNAWATRLRATRARENRITADARSAGAPRRDRRQRRPMQVPLLGRIAAGTPIEALQNKVGEVPVPGGMIGRAAIITRSK